MKNPKRIIALALLFVAISMFSMLTVTAAIISEQQTGTTDNGNIQIEAKYKKVTTYKVTFNANGGKVGTKIKVAKNINKGAKIKKFPATPKRKSYTFKGWYTKKSGGKKVSVNTKPTKSVTLYAHWKKGSSRTLNSEEKKLVGAWSTVAVGASVINSITGKSLYSSGNGVFYSFDADGTYSSVSIFDSVGSRLSIGTSGSWRLSGNTLYLTKKQTQRSTDGGKTFTPAVPSKDSSFKIRFGTENGRQYYVELMNDGTETMKRWKG
ncbi:MAG: InlB B-repeat-containing protein [Methanobrevibacter sp.]|nr:InlB B-repeat-containing protein [Methanobrevibacter sp.]